MAIRASTPVRNAALKGTVYGVAAVIDGDSGNATIEIYTGTVHASYGTQPAGTKIATLTLSRPSFQLASLGSMTANSIQSDVSANATGTMGCFVIRDPSGTIHIDGSVTVTAGGGNITFASVLATAADTIGLSSLTISIPQS